VYAPIETSIVADVVANFAPLIAMKATLPNLTVSATSSASGASKRFHAGSGSGAIGGGGGIGSDTGRGGSHCGDDSIGPSFSQRNPAPS
jgi:hypothetical protein